MDLTEIENEIRSLTQSLAQLQVRHQALVKKQAERERASDSGEVVSRKCKAESCVNGVAGTQRPQVPARRGGRVGSSGAKVVDERKCATKRAEIHGRNGKVPAAGQPKAVARMSGNSARSGRFNKADGGNNDKIAAKPPVSRVVATRYAGLSKKRDRTPTNTAAPPSSLKKLSSTSTTPSPLNPRFTPPRHHVGSIPSPARPQAAPPPPQRSQRPKSINTLNQLLESLLNDSNRFFQTYSQARSTGEGLPPKRAGEARPQHDPLPVTYDPVAGENQINTYDIIKGSVGLGSAAEIDGLEAERRTIPRIHTSRLAARSPHDSKRCMQRMQDRGEAIAKFSPARTGSKISMGK